MTGPVTLRREGDVALVVIDNPPVNALSGAVAEGIAACVAEAGRDGAVDAVVLICAGRTFIAGADIAAFDGQVSATDSQAVLGVIEDCPKPVVAALHGTAFGGGLEVALACHYRVALPDARVGLPEVKLGLLPGAGGTQRLPRLIGVEAALDMILSGRSVPAAEALRLGLVDRLLEGELHAGAVAFAREMAAARGLHPRLRDRAAEPRPAEFWEQARRRAQAAARGHVAPGHIVDCVRAATEQPFDQGVRLEAERFLACVTSRESQALRHLFFAEREAAKIPDVPRDTPVREVRRVGVVGAGTMGGGIAMCFAGAGFEVVLVDVAAEAVEKGLSAIRANYQASVRKGRLEQGAVDAALARIRGATGHAALADADLVIEAVFENMALKQEIFRSLDAVCRPGAILATNTSTLDVDRIAAATGRPGDVLGLHFFSPANVMRLLEVVRGAATAKDVLATAMQLARRIGKVAVVSGVCEGFIGNRMVAGYGREAGYLLLEGAAPQQIDRALVEFGFPMGPVAMGDLAGIDIGVKAADEAAKAGRGSADPRDGRVARRLVAMGRLGQKTGAGMYRYRPGDRTPQPDPEVEAIIAEEAAALGIARRPVSDGEIVERCVYPLVNEAARILEEGIALRPGDVDTVWVNGYGFPAFRGGPLFHADTVGLPEVLGAIRRYHDTLGGDHWRPAPLLVRLVQEGRRFADLR